MSNVKWRAEFNTEHNAYAAANAGALRLYVTFTRSESQPQYHWSVVDPEGSILRKGKRETLDSAMEAAELNA